MARRQLGTSAPSSANYITVIDKVRLTSVNHTLNEGTPNDRHDHLQ
jgi:hypothetical protein